MNPFAVENAKLGLNMCNRISEENGSLMTKTLNAYPLFDNPLEHYVIQNDVVKEKCSIKIYEK